MLFVVAVVVIAVEDRWPPIGWSTQPADAAESCSCQKGSAVDVVVVGKSAPPAEAISEERRGLLTGLQQERQQASNHDSS